MTFANSSSGDRENEEKSMNLTPDSREPADTDEVTDHLNRAGEHQNASERQNKTGYYTVMRQNSSQKYGGGGNPAIAARARRMLFNRRAWTLALSMFLFALCYVVTPIMGYTQEYSNAREDPVSYGLTAALQEQAQTAFGRSGIGCYAVIAVGILLALQGFAYLDSRREVDFYESQPMSRRSRFIGICLDSFLIFLMSYIIPLAAGLIISQGMGALTGEIFMEALVQAVRCVALYLAIYAYGVLAVMLTGTRVIAFLASCVLILYEPALRVMLQVYEDQYLHTGNGLTMSAGGGFTSPLVHYFFRSDLKGTVLNLIVFAVVLFIAYLCCTKRKNEYAGIAVPWRPVRVVVRIAVSVLGALLAGEIALTMSTTAFTVTTLVIAAFVIACIMEVIYEFNFRAFFRHVWEAFVSIGLVLLIFCAFYFDIFGTNTWTPKADNVKDCAILDNQYFTNHYYEDGTPVNGPVNDYYRQYMHLTDVQSVIDMVKDCNSRMRDCHGAYTTCTVLYRMKNGKNIEREFSIPENADPSVMNAVFGSEAFREGYFQIYHDVYVKTHIAGGTISYDNGLTAQTMDSGRYEDFKAAYEKDLQQFNYSFMKDNPVTIGTVTLMSAPDAENGYFKIKYPVYKAFSQTVEFLKAQGLHAQIVPEDVLKADIILPDTSYYIDQADQVVIYDPSRDTGEMIDSSEGAIVYGDTGTASDGVIELTQKEEIGNLLRTAVCLSFGPTLDENRDDDIDYSWTILLYGRDGKLTHIGADQEETDNVRMAFREGGVPQAIAGEIQTEDMTETAGTEAIVILE